MPLVGTVNHQVSLLQQQILPVYYGMQLPLVNIGQLRHRVGFAGKQKALLFLLIEKGINAIHMKLTVFSQQLYGLKTNRLRFLFGGIQRYTGVSHKGTQGKLHPGFQADRFVQIEVKIFILPGTDGQNGHSAAAGEPGLAVRHIDGSAVTVQCSQISILSGKGERSVCSFRQDRAIATEIDLVQVPYHVAAPPRRITG